MQDFEFMLTTEVVRISEELHLRYKLMVVMFFHLVRYSPGMAFTKVDF